MSDSSIGQKLDDFASSFTDWLLAVFHPVATCGSLLSELSERAQLRRTFSLWTASVIVSFAVQLPLLHQVGIEWNSTGYVVASFVVLTGVLVASGLCLQLSLRLYGIRSSFANVVSICFAYLMSYQPVLELLTYTQNARMFAALRFAKSHNMYFHQALWLFLKQAQASPQQLDFDFVVSNLASWVLLAGLCVSISLMMRTISDKYKVARVNAFRAIVFGIINVMFPIGLAQSYLIGYVVYSFMSARS